METGWWRLFMVLLAPVWLSLPQLFIWFAFSLHNWHGQRRNSSEGHDCSQAAIMERDALASLRERKQARQKAPVWSIFWKGIVLCDSTLLNAAFFGKHVTNEEISKTRCLSTSTMVAFSLDVLHLHTSYPMKFSSKTSRQAFNTLLSKCSSWEETRAMWAAHILAAFEEWQQTAFQATFPVARAPWWNLNPTMAVSVGARDMHHSIGHDTICCRWAQT